MVPTQMGRNFLMPICLLLTTLLCTGCTPHLHRSEGCMDEPLRNYLHKNHPDQ